MPNSSYKLTPDIHKKIVLAIRSGSYMETAAAFAGVSKNTLYHWLKVGERSSSGPERKFRDDVHLALAAAEVNCTALIGKAALKNWTAAAWMLERRHPERWGRQDRAMIETGVRKELEAAMSKLETGLSAEEYERVVRILSADTDRQPEAEEPGEPSVH